MPAKSEAGTRDCAEKFEGETFTVVAAGRCANLRGETRSFQTDHPHECALKHLAERTVEIGRGS